MALIEIPAAWLVLPLLLFPGRRLACFAFVSLSVFAMLLTVVLRLSIGDDFSNYGTLRFSDAFWGLTIGTLKMAAILCYIEQRV